MLTTLVGNYTIPTNSAIGNSGILTGNSNWNTTTIQPWVSSPSSNPYNNIWGGSTFPGVISSTTIYPEPNKLENLKYIINFYSDDDDDYAYLSDYISGVRKNKFIFNCGLDGNRIQPYETLMKFIKEHKKLSVKITLYDANDGLPFLIVSYTDLEFVKIENNLNFNGDDCDFSVLKVKFKYDKILYENKKLSLKELREDKLKKINEIK